MLLDLLLIVFALAHCSTGRDDLFSPELNMNVPQIIAYYGYPVEVHQAVTDDGYILTIHRIPYGKKSGQGSGKPVVYLQHGLFDSSFTWVANPPSQSLSYILADQGYDVWLANTRGNTYSRSHKTLSADSNAFWDFTWDDMAKNDLPALVNYILGVTKAAKLSYVGHSQGTEIMFAKLGDNGPLNSKISSFSALAPVAYLAHIKTPIIVSNLLANELNLAAQLLNHGEFLPSNDLVNKFTNLVCGNTNTVAVCSNVMFLIAGPNTANMNNTRVPIYTAHIPAGSSSKNAVHYAQSYQSKKFQKYDYGFFQNFFVYGSSSPPTWVLNGYGVPIGMFYGGQDWLAAPEDVNQTIAELGSSVSYTSYLHNYNHLDYVWGINANTDVYTKVIDFIKKYQ